MILAALLLQSALADDTVSMPQDSLHYTNATYGRVNPLGLVNKYRLGWKHRLSDSDSLLLKDTYTFVAGSVFLTPAYTRLGVYAEAQALSVLRVFGEVSAVNYFGTFNQFQSFPTTDGLAYDDATLALTPGETASAMHWQAGMTLRAAAGPVALRSTGAFFGLRTQFEDGDTVFYDQRLDRLIGNSSPNFYLDNDILVLAGKAKVGVRHSFTSDLGALTGDAGVDHHRVGPLFAYDVGNHDPGLKVQGPTLFVMSQWWLQHPYRTGQEQSQAIPQLVIGAAFKGDLRHN